MNKPPPKYEVIAFIKYLKKDWEMKDHSMGYDILCFLQEFIKNNYGGKRNDRKERDKKDS